MKETVGIEILIRSMNIEETFFKTTRRPPSKIIKEWNKFNPIQMNNFESSTCKKRLRLAIIWGRIKGWRELVSLGQQPQCTYYYSWSNSQVAARITSIKYDNSISWNVGCSNLHEKDTPSTPPSPCPQKKKKKKKERKEHIFINGRPVQFYINQQHQIQIRYIKWNEFFSVKINKSFLTPMYSVLEARFKSTCCYKSEAISHSGYSIICINHSITSIIKKIPVCSRKRVGSIIEHQIFCYLDLEQCF